MPSDSSSPTGTLGSLFLAIVFSYFEMIAKYRAGYAGTGESKKYFRDGFLWFTEGMSVSADIPELREAAVDKLYAAIRNGMDHDAITQAGVGLSGSVGEWLQIAWSKSTQQIVDVVINPRVLVERLQVHFSQYVNELLNPDSPLRAPFLSRYDWRESNTPTLHPPGP